MERERKFYLKIILGVYFIWFIFFEAVGQYASILPTRDFTSYMDRQIPFIPEFVWPYVLCYVFPFLPLFIIKDWHRFNRALLSSNSCKFLCIHRTFINFDLFSKA